MQEDFFIVYKVLVAWICAATFTVPTSLHAEDSQTIKTFNTLWETAEKAVAVHDDKNAIIAYQRILEIIPFEPTTHFRLACAYARLKETEKAYTSMEHAIWYGWADWRLLEKTPELKAGIDLERYVLLRRSAIACQTERILQHAGPKVDTVQPTPLLILLQGLGAGPRSELPYWKKAADELGLIVFVPRATNQINAMLAGWHRPGAKDSTALDYYDLPAASQRIDETIDLAKRRYTIDTSRIYLAGFSQGGGVALRLLGENPERFRGAIAVCSLAQSPGVVYWQPLARLGNSRIALLAGKLDRHFPRSQTVFEHLRTAGVPTELHSWEKVGHEYPADYQAQLLRALRYVIDGTAAAR